MLMAKTVKSISEKSSKEKEKRFLESYYLFYDMVSPQIEKKIIEEAQRGTYAASICFDFSPKYIKEKSKLAANEIDFYIEDIPGLDKATSSEILKYMNKLIKSIEDEGYIVNYTNYNQKIYRLIIFWG